MLYPPLYSGKGDFKTKRMHIPIFTNYLNATANILRVIYFGAFEHINFRTPNQIERISKQNHSIIAATHPLADSSGRFSVSSYICEEWRKWKKKNTQTDNGEILAQMNLSSIRINSGKKGRHTAMCVAFWHYGRPTAGGGGLVRWDGSWSRLLSNLMSSTRR